MSKALVIKPDSEFSEKIKYNCPWFLSLCMDKKVIYNFENRTPKDNYKKRNCETVNLLQVRSTRQA